jgi:hypothetical protein
VLLPPVAVITPLTSNAVVGIVFIPTPPVFVFIISIPTVVH